MVLCIKQDWWRSSCRVSTCLSSQFLWVEWLAPLTSCQSSEQRGQTRCQSSPFVFMFFFFQDCDILTCIALSLFPPLQSSDIEHQWKPPVLFSDANWHAPSAELTRRFFFVFFFLDISDGCRAVTRAFAESLVRLCWQSHITHRTSAVELSIRCFSAELLWQWRVCRKRYLFFFPNWIASFQYFRSDY